MQIWNNLGSIASDKSETVAIAVRANSVRNALLDPSRHAILATDHHSSTIRAKGDTFR